MILKVHTAPTPNMSVGAVVPPPTPTGALQGSDGVAVAGSDGVEITGSDN